MSDHLLGCSNKTEKCSNCSKSIPRAIYNDHLHNNCIDRDENKTDRGNNNNDPKQNSSTFAKRMTEFL